jgi:hypothetical protein
LGVHQDFAEFLWRYEGGLRSESSFLTHSLSLRSKQRSKTVTIFNLAKHFSALGKVVAVVGYYHMRVKGMAAYFAVSVLIVTGVRIVFVHGFDLSH